MGDSSSAWTRKDSFFHVIESLSEKIFADDWLTAVLTGRHIAIASEHRCAISIYDNEIFQRRSGDPCSIATNAAGLSIRIYVWRFFHTKLCEAIGHLISVLLLGAFLRFNATAASGAGRAVRFILEREFKIFNRLEGRVYTTCAPGDQEKS